MKNELVFEKLEPYVFVTKLAGFEHSEYIQPNATKTPLTETDIPMVQGKNIRNGAFVEKYDWYISKEIADTLPRSILNKKCILIPYVGSNLGELGIFPNHYRCHLASNIAKMELLNDKYDLEYVMYYLQSPIGQGYLFQDKQGSAQPNITMESIRSAKIIVKGCKEQKKIAKTLSLITKKIENNNAINNNLQEQAKLLYDYWFTQFNFPDINGNPYCQSGGKMIWNEELKRQIPESWEVIPLSEIMIKNTEQFDYSSNELTLDLSVMPQDSIALSEFNNSSNFSTNLYKMKKGDILFGSIRPYLKKAGFAPCDGVVAGTVHSYKVKNNENFNFALITLCRDVFFNYAVNVSAGTKMPVVSSDSILSYKVAFSNDIAKKFGQIDLLNTISNNIIENQELIALRNLLLPILMNGQATIED